MGRADTEPAAAPAVSLTLAGAATLRGPAGTLAALGPRDAALLAWLVLEGPTPRARLAGLLWPESEPDAARNNLRQRLFKLRRLAGDDVVIGSATLQLAPAVGHDLDDAEGLLADVPDEVGGEFSAWLAQQRERRRERVRHALVELVDMAEQARDYADALTHAKELLALDPLSEDAHRRVIRLHYLGGDRAAALLAFDHCEQVLKDEVGTRPSPETLALLQTVHEADAAAPVSARTLPASMMRPPRLAGRDAELAALAAALQAGQVPWISGEAGLGKSRLLDEAFMGRPGWVVAAARPGDDAVPFCSLARLLRAVRPAGGTPLDELHDDPLEIGRDPAARRAALRRRVTSWLAEAMQQGRQGLQGLVLDDLHFADTASVELVSSLCHVDALAGLLWAFAQRPAEGVPAVRALADGLLDAQRLRPLALAPLDGAGMAALVRSLGLPGAAPETLAEALHRHSGGNPLFALETLRQAFSAGRLEGLSAGELLPSPASVTLLIERRLARLSPQALQLARCAALAGPDLGIELAAEVMGVRPLALADAWSELERAQVLRDGAFAHDLIFEAALGSVPAPIARHLHAQIGEYLARRGGAPARIARHADAAGDWQRAAAAYRQAAEQALHGAHIGDAVDLLADAARCAGAAGDADGRHAALFRRAELLVHFDHGPTANDALRQLEAESPSPGQALAARVLRLELHSYRSEMQPLRELAPAAVHDARAQGRLDLEVAAAAMHAKALREDRRCAEALAVLQPYDERLAELPSWQSRFTFLSSLAISLDNAGRLHEALSVWDRILALPGLDDRADVRWQAMGNRAATLGKMGRVQAAAQAARQALLLATGTGSVPGGRLAHVRAVLAHMLQDIGHYQEAMALANAALEAAAQPYYRARLEHTLAFIYQQLGQPERALPLLQGDLRELPAHMTLTRWMHRADVLHDLGRDGLPLLRDALALVPDPDDIYHRLAALHATRLVPPEEGEALAASLVAWAAAQERMGFVLAGHVRAAACVLAQGAPRRALLHAEAALDLARDHQTYTFYLPEVWWVAAQVYRALDRPGDAQRIVDAGRAWVMAVHDEHVPAPFRASFLQRNAVNRGLLAGSTGPPSVTG